MIAYYSGSIPFTEGVHTLCQRFPPSPVGPGKNADSSFRQRGKFFYITNPADHSCPGKLPYREILAVARRQIDMNRPPACPPQFQQGLIKRCPTRPFIFIIMNFRDLNTYFNRILRQRRPINHLRHIVPDTARMLCGSNGKNRQLAVICLRQSRQIVP